MTILTITLISILVLFAFVLLLQQFFPFPVCALCTAVITTWLVLIILYLSGLILAPVLVGILMGGSIVGSMYLLEERLDRKFHVFRLVYFLSLVAATYSLIVGTITWFLVATLFAIWVVSLLIFFLREHPGFEAVAERIIKCCKNW
jgi:MFS family permease